MRILGKIAIIIVLIFNFSCDNSVTGPGDICTADPIGEWVGTTKTINYQEECGVHCAGYDLTYLNYTSYCSSDEMNYFDITDETLADELITVTVDPATFEVTIIFGDGIFDDYDRQYLCNTYSVAYYENIECYDYLDYANMTNIVKAEPPCDIYATQGECNQQSYCTWGGAGVPSCISGCEEEYNNSGEEFAFQCEWDIINSICSTPDSDITRLTNYNACSETEDEENCEWVGEGLGEDLDSNGLFFEGSCEWAREYEYETNIETEIYRFDEDGNFYFEGTSDDKIGDFSCSENNVELCDNGDCIIWDFSQNEEGGVSITRDYSDETTDYQEDCSAIETFIIERNND